MTSRSPRCEALKAVRRTRARCHMPANFVSEGRTQPPRVVCVHHHRRAPHGYTAEPLDLATLTPALLMTYLSRCDAFRTYCGMQVTRYLELERDAGTAAGACRRLLTERIDAGGVT